MVLVMPETGVVNALAEVETRLRAGDRVRVTVETTEDSTADIRYGKDNVTVKYIGINGSQLLDTANWVGEQAVFCGACGL